MIGLDPSTENLLGLLEHVFLAFCHPANAVKAQSGTHSIDTDQGGSVVSSLVVRALDLRLSGCKIDFGHRAIWQHLYASAGHSGLVLTCLTMV